MSLRKQELINDKPQLNGNAQKQQFIIVKPHSFNVNSNYVEENIFRKVLSCWNYIFWVSE